MYDIEMMYEGMKIKGRIWVGRVRVLERKIREIGGNVGEAGEGTESMKGMQGMEREVEKVGKMLEECRELLGQFAK